MPDTSPDDITEGRQGRFAFLRSITVAIVTSEQGVLTVVQRLRGRFAFGTGGRIVEHEIPESGLPSAAEQYGVNFEARTTGEPSGLPPPGSDTNDIQVENLDEPRTSRPAPLDVETGRPYPKEFTRRALALGLLLMVELLAAAAQAVIVWKVKPVTWDIEREFLTIVFTPLLAAAATAVGFYFATGD